MSAMLLKFYGINQDEIKFKSVTKTIEQEYLQGIIEEYDFDKVQITAGDYVRIESEYIEGTSTYASFDVYLYDVETNILYYIHNNI